MCVCGVWLESSPTQDNLQWILMMCAKSTWSHCKWCRVDRLQMWLERDRLVETEQNARIVNGGREDCDTTFKQLSDVKCLIPRSWLRHRSFNLIHAVNNRATQSNQFIRIYTHTLTQYNKLTSWIVCVAKRNFHIFCFCVSFLVRDFHSSSSIGARARA